MDQFIYIKNFNDLNQGDYIKIHIQGKKPVLTLMSIKKALEKLPEKDFIRVHRSYIVPINRIESVRGKVINLGITEIPIGKSHEEAFFKVYISTGY
jgi:DNA-binding LytR/AlgR family response regulator